MKVKCLGCDKEFETENKNKKYCCRACSVRKRRQDKKLSSGFLVTVGGNSFQYSTELEVTGLTFGLSYLKIDYEVYKLLKIDL